MDSHLYILEGHTPFPTVSVIHWGTWFETADRTVKQTHIGDAEVSTVFLGLDHQWGDGPPLLFETRVFGGERDVSPSRYSTWEDAETGHGMAVRILREQTTKLPQTITEVEC